jgi:serine/threonine protein phosphatase 1
VAPPCDAEPFGRLVRARRVWAVAAIHGEAERLERLHRQIEPRFEAGDRLVYLGDCLGHGPDPAAAVDLVLEFRRLTLGRRLAFLGDVVLLRGSQEEMWQRLLELQFAPNPREVLPWMLDHGLAATLRSYAIDANAGLAACREGTMAITRWTASIRAALDAHAGHRQYLGALRRAAFTEEGGLLFVNAGIDAEKPLELQGDVFWWGRSDVLSLAAPFSGFDRVVCGSHRRRAGLVETTYAAALDAGCGFGGPLVAACFDLGGSVLDRLEA